MASSSRWRRLFFTGPVGAALLVTTALALAPRAGEAGLGVLPNSPSNSSRGVAGCYQTMSAIVCPGGGGGGGDSSDSGWSGQSVFVPTRPAGPPPDLVNGYLNAQALLHDSPLFREGELPRATGLTNLDDLADVLDALYALVVTRLQQVRSGRARSEAEIGRLEQILTSRFESAGLLEKVIAELEREARELAAAHARTEERAVWLEKAITDVLVQIDLIAAEVGEIRRKFYSRFEFLPGIALRPSAYQQLPRSLSPVYRDKAPTSYTTPALAPPDPHSFTMLALALPGGRITAAVTPTPASRTGISARIQEINVGMGELKTSHEDWRNSRNKAADLNHDVSASGHALSRLQRMKAGAEKNRGRITLKLHDARTRVRDLERRLSDADKALPYQVIEWALWQEIDSRIEQAVEKIWGPAVDVSGVLTIRDILKDAAALGDDVVGVVRDFPTAMTQNPGAITSLQNRLNQAVSRFKIRFAVNLAGVPSPFSDFVEKYRHER